MTHYSQKVVFFNKRFFKCFKYISDSADENANKEWHETVANGEPHYINVWDTHTSNLNDYDTQLQLDMD